ncbi:MAG: tyrosine-type recombinase/integrase [Gammaproteobacteria bacterium]
MTPVAPHISVFLRDHLPRQKGASVQTCETYAYAFQLLFTFASQRLKVSPSALYLEQIDATLVMDFLKFLEAERDNGIRTRNARLVAIRSFMRFLEYRTPALLGQIQRVLAIPTKRADERLIHWLTNEEIEALLNAPDLRTRDGIRDRAMLHLCFAAGLRVSELVGLPLTSVQLQPTVQVQIQGKGRRERALPLWSETARDLRAWLAVRGDALVPEFFLNARGSSMTRFGFEYILNKHLRIAGRRCSSLTEKRITPHSLRHSCAMLVLQATGDIRKVSLWLGHASLQTTEVYLRADPTEKIEAIEKLSPPTLRRGHFRSPDKLLASLRG